MEAGSLGEVRDVVAAAEQAARSGAWVAGFVAYEGAPAFDPALTVRPRGGPLPLAWFGAFDERVDVPPIRPPAADRGKGRWRLDWTAEQHARAVAHIKDLLAAGETYQVNLTVRARSVVEDPLALYAGMAHAQGGAYNAYFETRTHAIVCASPELFFERKDGTVVTRPMKGTRPRGRWPAEDGAQADALVDSAKDRAEHIMIVDLLRNDLGRLARPGTVTVDDLATIERYHTVWQLTSTISAQLVAGAGLVDIFAALFPSGSVTGAPKPRTMARIADLEDRPRGVYCGAVGYLAPDVDRGPARFAVAIRTATVDKVTGEAEYGSGGGITWSSDAGAEWEEVRHKCAILDPPVRPPGLFETLRVEPDGRPVNLERHLDRLESSAGFFAIPFQRERVDKEVRAACRAAHRPQRARVSLAAGGALTVSLSEFPAVTPGPVRLGLANQPVDSQDRRLFFKSTDRRRYEEARASRPDVDDVILCNERGEVTETTIANLAVHLDGRWWTPALPCGLLPGVERGRLIDVGELAERVITVDEVRRARRLAVINSLRGWRAAILVDAATGAGDPWRCG
jgi:para-aminobenzoate synthetase/4-amino-4-deoxychorismate lyase